MSDRPPISIPVPYSRSWSGAQASRTHLATALWSCGSSAGENGHLQLDELPRTPIVAELVVLSACETGRGRILAGEGVWGFQSQFLSAGAKNVVGTLWRVEDESTAEFMEEFYREMGPELTDYAHALRASKLKLLHSGKWHHPYYWAPFVLYGEAPTSK